MAEYTNPLSPVPAVAVNVKQFTAVTIMTIAVNKDNIFFITFLSYTNPK
jgi:hypothetical protein